MQFGDAGRAVSKTFFKILQLQNEENAPSNQLLNIGNIFAISSVWKSTESHGLALRGDHERFVPTSREQAVAPKLDPRPGKMRHFAFLSLWGVLGKSGKTKTSIDCCLLFLTWKNVEIHIEEGFFQITKDRNMIHMIELSTKVGRSPTGIGQISETARTAVWNV